MKNWRMDTPGGYPCGGRARLVPHLASHAFLAAPLGLEMSLESARATKADRSAFHVGDLFGYQAIPNREEVDAADVAAVPVVAPPRYDARSRGECVLDREPACPVVENWLPRGGNGGRTYVALPVGRRRGLEHAVVANERQRRREVMCAPGGVEPADHFGRGLGLVHFAHPPAGAKQRSVRNEERRSYER